jgi:hypothetical protein
MQKRISLVAATPHLANTSLTNARIAGAERKLTEIA